MEFLPVCVQDACCGTTPRLDLIQKVTKWLCWRSLRFAPNVSDNEHLVYYMMGRTSEYLGEATQSRQGIDSGLMRRAEEHANDLVVYGENDKRATCKSRKALVFRKGGMQSVMIIVVQGGTKQCMQAMERLTIKGWHPPANTRDAHGHISEKGQTQTSEAWNEKTATTTGSNWHEGVQRGYCANSSVP